MLLFVECCCLLRVLLLLVVVLLLLFLFSRVRGCCLWFCFVGCAYSLLCVCVCACLLFFFWCLLLFVLACCFVKLFVLVCSNLL